MPHSGNGETMTLHGPAEVRCLIGRLCALHRKLLACTAHVQKTLGF